MKIRNAMGSMIGLKLFSPFMERGGHWMFQEYFLT